METAMNLLTFFLIGINPIGFNVNAGFGVPSGPIAREVISANRFSIGARFGDDRWVGAELTMTSMPGIAAPYSVGFAGLEPNIGMAFGKFYIIGKAGAGKFWRRFSSAQESGFSSIVELELGLNIVESSFGALATGIYTTVFPSKTNSIILYGINLSIMGLVWQ